MLKSCSYCGGIHKRGEVCPKKPKQQYSKKKNTKANQFRRTAAWKEKSERIRYIRDHNLCQVCIRNLYSTVNQYNFHNIQVHHIEPIEQEYDLRLDNDNLISLCKNHHDMAESGMIDKDTLKKIAKEQNGVLGV